MCFLVFPLVVLVDALTMCCLVFPLVVLVGPLVVLVGALTLCCLVLLLGFAVPLLLFRSTLATMAFAVVESGDPAWHAWSSDFWHTWNGAPVGCLAVEHTNHMVGLGPCLGIGSRVEVVGGSHSCLVVLLCTAGTGLLGFLVCLQCSCGSSPGVGMSCPLLFSRRCRSWSFLPSPRCRHDH